MNRAVLVRGPSSVDGTFGEITFPGGRLFTGELSDHDNAPNISRIPAGEYRCDFTYSPAFKRRMYLVRAVPGRSGIRIHSANYCGDRAAGKRCHLYGCIALGRRLGVIHGQRAILVSRPAMSDFETAMGRQPFMLEVIDG